MRKTLYIVNGYPRAGKDTLMDMLAEEMTSYDLTCFKHSTIDTVKKAAKIMGWNGEKTPEMRCFLSDMKDLFTKYLDGPLNEIKSFMNPKSPVDVLFTAMREPDEIQRTKEWCLENEVNCIAILVRGANEETEHTSHSDSKVLTFPYDVTFTNGGTLDDLKEKVESYVNYIMK